MLYVHPFAEAISGPDESLLVLLAHLGRNVAATVALPAESPFIPRYRAVGADVMAVPVSRLARFRSPGEVARYVHRLVASSASLWRRGFRRFDLVHANMEVCLEAGVVARAWGVPCVYHYRGNTNDDPRRVFDALTAVWTTLGDHVFAISGPCAEIFGRRGRGGRVEVLHNAIALERFRAPIDRAAIRRALGIAPDDRVVITVGRLHPRKDLATFLRAAARIARARRTTFLIAGAGSGPEGVDYESSLRRLADALGLGPSIRFLGVRDDVPELLGASDVFVMTSRHEGFGRAVAEAMASGLPSVLAREGAFPELIVDGVSGVLADPGDPTSFSDSILALLEDTERRLAMGGAARCRAEELFDARAQARRVLAVYEELVVGKE